MTDQIALVVAANLRVTSTVFQITFARPDGTTLPGYDAGAHITLEVPGVGQRKYSLLNFDPTAGATRAPTHYTLGVRREAEGQGGSLHVCDLEVGASLWALPPKNDFPLHASTAVPLLLAGGIGVTPLVSMAAELAARNQPCHFIYAARARGEFAFLDDLRRLTGDRLTLHADDETGRVLDVAPIFAALAPDQPVYMCGPKPMLKAGIAASRSLRWPPTRLRYELFYSVAAQAAAASP
jgi:vanillate O-demethylase ferredoxin subunit